MDAAKSRNSRWLNSKIKEGYTIYDIGVDASPATRSPFYRLEKGIIKKKNYPTIKLP